MALVGVRFSMARLAQHLLRARPCVMPGQSSLVGSCAPGIRYNSDLTEKPVEYQTDRPNEVRNTSTDDTPAQDHKAPSSGIDYSYFQKVVDVLGSTKKQVGVVMLNPEPASDIESAGASKGTSIVKHKSEPRNMNLRNRSLLKPKMPRKSATLVPYVNESEVLQKMIQLSVDLSKVEQEVKVANHLLKCDFERDIGPRIRFLCDLGVPKDKLGLVITRHPQLLTNDMEHMEVRMNYFLSKNFSPEAIARIVTMAPGLLSKSTVKVDAHLGFLQKEFQLNGDEVRTAVTLCPKIALYHPYFIKEFNLSLKELLGFTEEQRKFMLLTHPRIYLQRREAVIDRFDYLHNTMGIDHETIANWSTVLRTRTSVLKARHLFLQRHGRAQYDRTKPNYVSLRALVTGRDRDFSYQVAKVPVSEFNDFLKTL